MGDELDTGGPGQDDSGNTPEARGQDPPSGPARLAGVPSSLWVVRGPWREWGDDLGCAASAGGESAGAGTHSANGQPGQRHGQRDGHEVDDVDGADVKEVSRSRTAVEDPHAGACEERRHRQSGTQRQAPLVEKYARRKAPVGGPASPSRREGR